MIWGVDCSRQADGSDVAGCEFPLKDAKCFKSWLEGAVSGCTVPPHEGVVHLVIESGNNEEGYVVTYMPASNNAPHQTVADQKYLMRAGSSFVPVPHQILSGMFGRRPQPELVSQWVSLPVTIVENCIQCQLGVMLRNESMGIARDAFLHIRVLAFPGPKCQIAFEFLDKENWSGSFAFGRFWNLISKTDYRIPPKAFAQPVALNITFAPPFEHDLRIEQFYGCEGGRPSRWTLANTASQLAAIHEGFLAKYRSKTLTNAEWENVTGHLLGIKFSD